MHTIVRLKPEEVLHHWVLVEPYVDSFLAQNGESTTFSIGQGAINGYNHVWMVFDADENLTGAVVTTIDDFPACKALHIIGLAGVEYDDWKHLFNSSIYPFAKDKGCSEVTFWGRRGWLKKHRDFFGGNGEQFKEKHVIMAMQLQETNMSITNDKEVLQ